jgi:hypothetical protein
MLPLNQIKVKLNLSFWQAIEAPKFTTKSAHTAVSLYAFFAG